MSREWSECSTSCGEDGLRHQLYDCESVESKINEPAHDKTNKMACAPSEDSDQPGHPPSLIRIFAMRSGLKLSSCGQRRL